MAGTSGLAENLRARLEPESPMVTEGLTQGTATVDPLDEISAGKSIRKHVREFAAVFGILALIFAGGRIHHNDLATAFGLLVVALVLTGLGYLAPQILKPVWTAWMNFAEALGMVMTSVILGLSWIIMMIPVGIILKICQIKVMNTRFRDPTVKSYWEDREEKLHDFKLLERQF